MPNQAETRQGAHPALQTDPRLLKRRRRLLRSISHISYFRRAGTRNEAPQTTNGSRSDCVRRRHHHGSDNGRASADYTCLYHGNAALLAESLEAIQRTAAVILSALETDSEEQETEPEIELRSAAGRRTYDIWLGFWPKARSPMADGDDYPAPSVS